ncbi:MAG: serine/threonine protein kinase [Sandaracinaceae bacterium]|nr:serine/threonine protein kinase [Sandaracinaceae bacterium]
MTAPEPAFEDPLIGRVVQGRFLVLARLAAGGMGVVYKAEQQPLGRVIALKILESKQNASVDASFSRRFLLEASAAAKLAHPNTIVVHDYGKTEGGLYFIAMEHLDGGSLGDRLKKHGPLTPAQAIHVGMQVASSLADAHAQGLVHRDLKPGNVMFAARAGDPFFVKVLDFGLVKVLGSEDENVALTQSGVMMGSPRYMAPEQVKAQPVDHRADIYAFGAMLYHMVAGAPPFAAGSAFEAMHAHVNTPPPPLRATWPHCPAGPRLEAVIMRCLAKDPAQRFLSMNELMSALHACQSEAGALGAGASGWTPLASSQAVSLVSSGAHRSRARARAATRAPSISRSGVAPSGSHKTMRFESAEVPAPAAPPAASSAAPVAPTKSGGALKILAGLAALVVVIAGAVAAAWTLSVMRDGAAAPPTAQSARTLRPGGRSSGRRACSSGASAPRPRLERPRRSPIPRGRSARGRSARDRSARRAAPAPLLLQTEPSARPCGATAWTSATRRSRC